MLKIAKFGGSSLANAQQFRKVRDIVRADESRRVIVVSGRKRPHADCKNPHSRQGADRHRLSRQAKGLGYAGEPIPLEYQRRA